jgi:hypothetical protein
VPPPEVSTRCSVHASPHPHQRFQFGGGITGLVGLADGLRVVLAAIWVAVNDVQLFLVC